MEVCLTPLEMACIEESIGLAIKDTYALEKNSPTTNSTATTAPSCCSSSSYPCAKPSGRRVLPEL